VLRAPWADRSAHAISLVRCRFRQVFTKLSSAPITSKEAVCDPFHHSTVRPVLARLRRFRRPALCLPLVARRVMLGARTQRWLRRATGNRRTGLASCLRRDGCRAAGVIPMGAAQAKIAAMNSAGFSDPFASEEARQGADKMNNIIAMCVPALLPLLHRGLCRQALASQPCAECRRSADSRGGAAAGTPGKRSACHPCAGSTRCRGARLQGRQPA